MEENFYSYLLLFFLLIGVKMVWGQPADTKIDSHIHLYDINREESYTFLDSQEKNGSDELRFTHLENQFLETASSSGVKYAYIVEESERREDNFSLSQIADTSKNILGFSANLDPLVEMFAADLDSLKKNPNFRGVRSRFKELDLTDSLTLEKLGELDKRNLAFELAGNHNMSK